jgi:ATP-binding cassette subfamily B protein
LPLAALIAYGAARLGASAFGELRDALFARVAARAGRRTALRVYDHLFQLSLGYHLQRRTGELARAIERGVHSVTFLLDTGLFSLGPTLLEFLFVIGILLWKYPPAFALIAFVTVAAYAAFTIFTTNWRTKFRREMNRLDNEFSGQAVDGLINYEVVKAFANEGFESRRLDRALESYEHASVKSQISLSFLNAGQAAIIAVGVTAIMVAAALEVVAGRLSVGDVVLVNAFVLQLYMPLNFLGVVYRELRQSMTDLENIDGLLNLRSRGRGRAGRPPAPRSAAARSASRACASPTTSGGRSWTAWTSSIPAGRKLAVVGPSGAGKSTLVRLLFRFYEVTGGGVSVDGQDVRSVTQDTLRRAIGVVPQDTVLLQRHDRRQHRLRPARGHAGGGRARGQGGPDPRLHRHPAGGLRTVVGERGLKLSGGEKQRVAIARVVLKTRRSWSSTRRPPRSTPRTEMALQADLERVAEGRTTLVIAHRLSTVVDADEIVVLEAGGRGRARHPRRAAGPARPLPADVDAPAGEPAGGGASEGGGVGPQPAGGGSRPSTSSAGVATTASPLAGNTPVSAVTLT